MNVADLEIRQSPVTGSWEQSTTIRYFCAPIYNVIASSYAEEAGSIKFGLTSLLLGSLSPKISSLNMKIFILPVLLATLVVQVAASPVAEAVEARCIFCEGDEVSIYITCVEVPSIGLPFDQWHAGCCGWTPPR